MPKQRTNQGYVCHSTLQDYISILGEETVEKEYKVSVVRNPWDRAFACWRFFVKPYRETTFEAWLKEGGNYPVTHPMTPHIYHPLDHLGHYRDNNEKLNVNKLLRFENLAEDFKQLSDKPLPTIGEFGPTNYREHYTNPWMIDYVGGLNTELCASFGYTF
jgi:hypothetical protein